MRRYNPKEIEPKWQKIWDEQQTHKADLNSSKPKYYAMSMLNYPSGSGIHIGHAMNYTISDVMARAKRQQGFESYHPIGWDAFGLPAENYAIKSGESPQKSMARIIPNYHKQYKAMGWSNDWSREVSTHEPEYYKWTQWIFSQMYKHGLAYQASRMQWWCAIDNTVLADEQVTAEGKCWRHDGPNDPLVERREVKQWFFKITDYADELLQAIDELDWSESVKLAQKNWIGKSQGALIDFKLDSIDEKIQVFTTRPDTIFGATFLVVAPEHPLLEKLTLSAEAKDYIAQAKRKTELERQENKDKTGVETGLQVTNPASGEKLQVWIADYVIMGYGTGAIMAVPAHDQRDNDFAKKYDLPIKPVVAEVFGKTLPDAKDVEGVVVIGYNPKTNKYMGLKRRSGKSGSEYWLVGGGREEGEEFIESAIRELSEEAGFSEYEQIVQLGDPVYSYYHNPIKNVNRRSLGVNFLAFLDSTKAGETHQEAHEDFELHWADFDEIYRGIEGTNQDFGADHWLDALQKAKAAVERILSKAEPNPKIYEGEGILINSGKYDGMSSSDAREKIVADLARPFVSYRMRDWSVGRQRYWGAPIPIIHCQKCGPVLVPDQDLPVVLPELKDFEPSGDGRSALARATNWLKVECPECGGPAERETDTIDTYVDSAWYFLRYLDPANNKDAFDSKVVNHWMPVDFYNGADHATAHMIYARFVTRFFAKLGLVDEPEPFKKFLFSGKVVGSDGKMFSKSKNNGVDPLEIIDSGYGADALRMYLMFAAPLDQWMRWDPQGVPGTFRFLSRLWNLTFDFLYAKPKAGENKAILRTANKTIKKVTEDIDAQKYNTAIAAMMQAVNELYAQKAADEFSGGDSWRFALESLAQLVAPFAPHIAEELWHELGHQDSINVGHWPVWDEKLASEDVVTIAVQINGKVRAEIEVPANVAEQEAVEHAKQAASSHLAGKQITKAIYIPGRLVSLVSS